MIRAGFQYLNTVDTHRNTIYTVNGDFNRRGEIEHADEARRYAHNAFIDTISIFLRLANGVGIDVSSFRAIISNPDPDRNRDRVREWFTNVVTIAGKIKEGLEVRENAVEGGARKAPSGRARKSA